MKIAELSGRSGTSIASIKYYLREGLLAGGAATGRNQAEYDESHLRRLRLIRALIDIGGLSIASVRDVLSAVDTPGLDGNSLMGAAHEQLTRPSRLDRAGPQWQSAMDEVRDLVRRRGWYVSDDSPNMAAAADAIAAIRMLDQADLLEMLDTYADAAQSVAGREVEIVAERLDPSRVVEGVVVGTILGEALLGAFRRIAQQDASVRRVLTPAELDELSKRC